MLKTSDPRKDRMLKNINSIGPWYTPEGLDLRCLSKVALIGLLMGDKAEALVVLGRKINLSLNLESLMQVRTSPINSHRFLKIILNSKGNSILTNSRN